MPCTNYLKAVQIHSLSPGEIYIYIYIQIDLLSILYIKKHDFVRINFKLLVWPLYFMSPTDKLCQYRMKQLLPPKAAS